MSKISNRVVGVAKLNRGVIRSYAINHFVYLEPDPQHLCGMNPASLEMHNY